MRRTKILATLGPASADEAKIAELMEAGVDAVRLNFSHGEAEGHRALYAAARAAARRLRRPLAVLQDLQGPKIRLGRLPGGRVLLGVGDTVEVIYGESTDRVACLPCSYEPFGRDVREGDRVLLDDGRCVLRVLDARPEVVRCRVEVGGEVSDHKGINLPGVALSTPALTAKDREDLALGLELGVDYVALSFVRSVDDVRQAREAVGSTPLIAKIEKPEVLPVVESVLELVDGVMVARGDLGVELGPERVPMLQKDLIRRANAQGKLVITATEMLETMRYSPRPTRAEVSDVANAVLDGTDAVMLSGETATGAYPVDAVRMMDRVVEETERTSGRAEQASCPLATLPYPNATNAIARACVAAAEEISCRAILCYTESGAIALTASEYRPRACLIAATERESVYHALALRWGVTPLLLPRAPQTAEQVVDMVTAAAVAAGRITPGEEVVVAAGSRLHGPSDMVVIHRA